MTWRSSGVSELRPIRPRPCSWNDRAACPRLRSGTISTQPSGCIPALPAVPPVTSPPPSLPCGKGEPERDAAPRPERRAMVADCCSTWHRSDRN